MKYTLHGFSQETALELGISNDELALLRWFIDFKDSGTMKKKYDVDKQKMFYWIVYTKIIEDLPILTLGSETLEAKKKKLQRLINGNVSKVIEKKIERDKNGTYLYIAINEDEYIKLVASNLKEQDKTEMSEGYGQICPKGVGQNSPNKDYSINNNYSINNKKNSSSKDEITNIINQIWREYPNKKGKADAVKKIPKILKSISKEELIKAIERYRKDVENQRNNGFKTLSYANGSTFFNGRYMDYLEDIEEKTDKPTYKPMEEDFDY